MNSREAVALSKLGQTQEAVLLWLGGQCGLKTLAEVKSPLQRFWLESTLESIVEQGLPFLRNLREQRAEDDRRIRSKNADPEKTEAVGTGRIDVRWSAEAFLGHAPTRSESAALSTALAKLQKRGLLYIRSDGAREAGHKPRARFVRLTRMGVEVCTRKFEEQVQARDQAFIENRTGPVPELEV